MQSGRAREIRGRLPSTGGMPPSPSQLHDLPARQCAGAGWRRLCHPQATRLSAAQVGPPFFSYFEGLTGNHTLLPLNAQQNRIQLPNATTFINLSAIPFFTTLPSSFFFPSLLGAALLKQSHTLKHSTPLHCLFTSRGCPSHWYNARGVKHCTQSCVVGRPEYFFIFLTRVFCLCSST